MDAVINVMKPAGMTSMNVVSRVRRITDTKKAGHTGTLDPDVTGVLPVFVGKYTKAIHYLENEDKEYRAKCTLGMVTDTQDGSGEVLEAKGCDLSVEETVEALMSFVGAYDQLPPMYSAKQVNGQRLYDLARQGVEVERKSKKVNIYSINVLNTTVGESAGIDGGVHTVEIEFDVKCSRGTYIRTLCHDLGQKLGCGAYMSHLIRTRSGSFCIDNSLTFEELENRKESGTLSEILIPLEDVFKEYPRLTIAPREMVHFLNGVRMNRLSRNLVAQLRNAQEMVKNEQLNCRCEDGFYALVLDESGEPKAVAKVIADERFEIRMDRKFAD